MHHAYVSLVLFALVLLVLARSAQGTVKILHPNASTRIWASLDTIRASWISEAHPLRTYSGFIMYVCSGQQVLAFKASMTATEGNTTETSPEFKVTRPPSVCGDSVKFVLKFQNEAGQQEVYESDVFDARYPVPSEPLACNVTALNSSALQAQWQQPSNVGKIDGDDVAKNLAYPVYVYRDGRDIVDLLAVPGGQQTVSAIISGLQANTMYRVQIVAKNNYGYSRSVLLDVRTLPKEGDTPKDDTKTQTVIKIVLGAAGAGVLVLGVVVLLVILAACFLLCHRQAGTKNQSLDLEANEQKKLLN